MTTSNAVAEKAKAAISGQQTTNAVQKNSLTRSALQDLLTQMQPQIKAALPKHITPERIIRVAITAVSRNPKLLECEKSTLLGSIIQASQLGLEMDGALGHAYLVPFRNNKTNRMECQMIPGYKGYIDLARRSDRVKSLMAQIVCEGDEFEYEYGIHEQLRHVPAKENRGSMIYVYAYATFTNGGYAFVVLTKSDVDKSRARSKAAQSGPWVTDFEAMARKTAVRRLSTWLPLSVEFAKTVALDEKATAGQSQGLDLGNVDLSTGEIVTEEETQDAEVVDESTPAEKTDPDPKDEKKTAAAKIEMFPGTGV